MQPDRPAFGQVFDTITDPRRITLSPPSFKHDGSGTSMGRSAAGGFAATLPQYMRHL